MMKDRYYFHCLDTNLSYSVSLEVNNAKIIAANAAGDVIQSLAITGENASRLPAAIRAREIFYDDGIEYTPQERALEMVQAANLLYRADFEILENLDHLGGTEISA